MSPSRRGPRSMDAAFGSLADDLAPETLLAEVQRVWSACGRRGDRGGGSAERGARRHDHDFVFRVGVGAGARPDGSADHPAGQRAAESRLGPASSMCRRGPVASDRRRPPILRRFAGKSALRMGAVPTGRCAILTYTDSLTPRRAMRWRGTGAFQRHRRIVGERRRR